MADYYPLLARALDSLPDKDGEARKVVYERAKAALLGQLRGVDPPLPQEALDREIASLDEAIARIEAEQSGARKAAGPPAPASDDAAGEPEPPRTENAAEDGPARPRVEGVQIKRGGSRNRSVLVAVGLVAVIVPIAVLAWFWRDKSEPRQNPGVSVTEQQKAPVTAPAEPKNPERVGGPAPSREETAAQDRPAAGAGVAVAQKAALVEENGQDSKQAPKMTSGRAVWRLDVVNAGQGHPLETVVRATVEIPDAGLTLQLALKRNRDSALPASHTIELSFTTPPDDPGRAVRDVNPLLFRADDGARGVPVAALSVPVKENVFLIGLSDLKNDLERNVDLIRNRNWLELPLQFASGVRATLVFEKGVAGDRVVTDAFKAWEQP